MASKTVRKNGSVRIEWNNLAGKRKTATANDGTAEENHRLADKWIQEIEALRGLGQDWIAPKKRSAVKAAEEEAKKGPSIDDALVEWLHYHYRRAGNRRSNTYKTYEVSKDLFERWLVEAGADPNAKSLFEVDGDTLMEWVLWLRMPETSQLKDGRRDGGVKELLRFLMSGLRWASRQPGVAGLWTPPDMPAVDWTERPPKEVPSFSEVAQVTLASTGWLRRALTIAYYTGLRSSQVMHLRWGDIELDKAELLFPGSLGKSPQEKKGRLIPISPHLVEELRGWAEEDEIDLAKVERRDLRHRGGGPFIVRVDLARTQRRPRRRNGADVPGEVVEMRVQRKKNQDLSPDVVKKLWEDLGLWKPTYLSPVHSFRSAVAQGLVIRGAKIEAVARLLGHALGTFTLERYSEPDKALREPMERAVRMIPKLEMAAADAGEAPKSLAEVLMEFKETHAGALEALAKGGLPAGAGSGRRRTCCGGWWSG